MRQEFFLASDVSEAADAEFTEKFAGVPGA
jgi:hypothetical protein